VKSANPLKEHSLNLHILKAYQELLSASLSLSLPRSIQPEIHLFHLTELFPFVSGKARNLSDGAP